MATDSANGERSVGQLIAGSATLAAAAFLLVSAVVTVVQGISALLNDNMVMVGPQYVYRFNGTAWGLIHLVLGVSVAAIAVGLFWGVMWARVAAVLVAALSIVTMFLWLPHSPVWAVVVIALDILVIWAVCTWDSRAARTSGNEVGGAPSTLRAHRHPESLWPESSEWLTIPSWATLNPVFGAQRIRLEERVKDGRYEIGAELPGIDPVTDVDITTRNGVLTIRAERSDTKDSNGRSEFVYGSFVRSVSLPPGAREDDITASYDKGILRVSVGMSEAGSAGKRVQVQAGA